MKQKESGFTLIEMLTVLAIMAVMAAMVIPNMGQMIKEYELKNAVRQMVSSLQNIKMRAIKENVDTKLFVQQDAGTGAYFYQLFVDVDDDDTIDAGEDYARVDINENLTITANTFAGNIAGFNSRGLPDDGNGGTITITLPGVRSISIVMNTVGNIRVN